MKKKIAFFDFDGTVTTRDSLLELIRFMKGSPSLYFGFGLMSPWLIAMKLGIISNTPVKEMALRYFFGGMPLRQFNESCEKFARERLPKFVRPQARLEIRNLLQKGVEVVIVSASPENYLAHWCRDNQLACICSRLECKQGLITGRLDGPNCHGYEKVRRINGIYHLGEYEEVFAYGDSSADKPMMALATTSFYKPFRN